MALKFHPDKLGENYNDEAKAHWLKIQDAYEHLSDPVKKKKYDSTLPFNDSIPKQEDISDETFYDLFDEVFKRNARFAKKKPVPNIGNPETPLAEVNKFYKYWDNFDTWREFSQYDEYNLEEAGDRYERRYMEQENKKLRAVHEKAERKRLIKLAELAYNNDPRIRMEKELQEAEKLRKKLEKREFKAQKAREAEEREKEVQRKKELEEQEKQQAIEKEKELKKQADLQYKAKVKELIDLCEQKLAGTKYDKFWVQSIIKRYNTTEKVQVLVDYLSTCEHKDAWQDWITDELKSDAEK